MTDHIWLFVLSQFAVGAGVYAAIRADLRELHIRIDHLERWQERREANSRD